MSKATVTFTGVAAVVAGVVIGSSDSASSDVTAKPEVRTVTKTETVTEIQVPQSCLRAIHAGEKIMGTHVPRFAEATVGYIDLIQRAAEAGAGMDVAGINQVRQDMEELTADVGDIHRDIKPLGDTFKANRDLCEAAEF